ncbi:unnamed protein product [Pelagomonas calceolata]|uniref:Uncharacterized protein n=1 Tax=Pelagomonas calceolata TaxID=35677 RepID=A0A8J2S8I3_9STRA|nr:unnamed protein product [Pelagomonas calceolata]
MTLHHKAEEGPTPGRDPRYRQHSVARAVARSRLDATSLIRPVLTYLLYAVTIPFNLASRACAMLSEKAGNRSHALLSAAGQQNSKDAAKTDAVCDEACAVLAHRMKVDRLSGGRVIEATTVVLFHNIEAGTIDARQRDLVISGLGWSARCAFALLNRMIREHRMTMCKADFDRCLEMIQTRVVGSRREELGGLLRAGDETKHPVIFTVVTTVVPAPPGHPAHGLLMLPLVVSFIAMVSQPSMTSTSMRRFYEDPFFQALLVCVFLHFGVSPGESEAEIDVIRAQIGRARQLQTQLPAWWGFDEGPSKCGNAVFYGMSHAEIARVPERIAKALLSDAHTKGPHKILDLNSRVTVELILEAAREGSPCGDVAVLKLLGKPEESQCVAV